MTEDKGFCNDCAIEVKNLWDCLHAKKVNIKKKWDKDTNIYLCPVEGNKLHWHRSDILAIDRALNDELYVVRINK